MEDFLTSNTGVIVIVGTLIAEVVLKKIPRAWPLTRILKEISDKIVKDNPGSQSK